MATTDKIKQMQEKNYSEDEIVQNLRAEGISPREIEDSLSQLKIKSAIYASDNDSDVGGMEQSISSNYPARKQQQFSQPYQTYPIEQIPQQFPQQPQFPPLQTPYPQEQYPQEQYAQEQMAPEYGEVTPTEGYAEGYEGYSEGLASNDMVTEITEQVVAEKMDRVNKKVSELSAFKTSSESRIENIDTRLQKIESILDQLQIAIMKKISGYVEDIGDIKTELRAMQGSFGKVFSPLSQNIHELKKIAKRKTKKKK